MTLNITKEMWQCHQTKFSIIEQKTLFVSNNEPDYNPTILQNILQSSFHKLALYTKLVAIGQSQLNLSKGNQEYDIAYR